MSSDPFQKEMTDKAEQPVKTILIADDRYDNRYLLETLLTGNGFRVISTKNGEEAFEILKSEKIDAIISDILMPVMDGHTLCQAVKKDLKLAQLPFIFYTASYTEPRHRQYGLSLGADEYICKPSEPEELIAIIRKYL